MKRLVVQCNGQMLLYYSAVMFPGIEIWMWREDKAYFPIHKLAKKLVSTIASKLQPFLHAFSGKDDTSFLYGVGKTKFLNASNTVDCSCLCEFGNLDTAIEVTDDINLAASTLVMAAYGERDFTSLPAFRSHLFLSGAKKDLQSLPPTDDAWKQHLLRSLYATIVKILLMWLSQTYLL